MQGISAQIARVLADLLKNSKPLDPDAKRALYENLWDLYSK